LALFAGVGGGILGSRLLGWRTVCAVEIEPYCREVLLRRQEEKILEAFPIWDDIRTFSGREWRGKVDVITAGFPCQPFSSAAHGNNPKESLFSEVVRVTNETRPGFVMLENVVGVKRHFRRIVSEFRGIDFSVVPPANIGASSVGAPHKRRRIWILAYSNSARESALQEYDETQGVSEAQERRVEWWDHPRMARVYDGDAHRMDRIKATGNAQVPGVVEVAWKVLTNVCSN